jgi:hypothetical protein
MAIRLPHPHADSLKTKNPASGLETGLGRSHKAPPMGEKEKAKQAIGYRSSVMGFGYRLLGHEKSAREYQFEASCIFVNGGFDHLEPDNFDYIALAVI